MLRDLINQSRQIWRTLVKVKGQEDDHRLILAKAFELYILDEFEGVGLEVVNFLKREGDLELKRKVGVSKIIFDLTRKFKCGQCGQTTLVYEFWLKGSVLGSQPVYWRFRVDANVMEPGAQIELHGARCEKCNQVWLLHDVVPDVFWKGLRIAGQNKETVIDLSSGQMDEKILVHCALPSRLYKKSKEINDFVSSKGCGPFNPFDAFNVSRFEKGCMGRKRTMEICLRSVEICDEMWVFGVSEGVLAELKRVMDLNKVSSERHQKPIRVYVDQFDTEWKKRLSSFVGDPKFTEQVNFLRQKLIGV